jgi:hypothetical protein
MQIPELNQVRFQEARIHFIPLCAEDHLTLLFSHCSTGKSVQESLSARGVRHTLDS